MSTKVCLAFWIRFELARLADRLGYKRYWLAEHHNLATIGSSAPEIMIGHVANVTERMRVGAGGIMLPNQAPLKVAETFRVLEALHPKRIDLGIGRAPGTDPVTATALRPSQDGLGADDFPERFGELLAFSGGGFAKDHPFRSVVAMPSDIELPPIWLLGLSDHERDCATRGLHTVGASVSGHYRYQLRSLPETVGFEVCDVACVRVLIHVMELLRRRCHTQLRHGGVLRPVLLADAGRYSDGGEYPQDNDDNIDAGPGKR